MASPAAGAGAASSSGAAAASGKKEKGKGKAAKPVLPASWDHLTAPTHLLASASGADASGAVEPSGAAAGGAGAASASAASAASESGRLASNPFPITIAANTLLSGAGIDKLLAAIHGAFATLAAANASWPDVAALVKSGEPTGAMFVLTDVLNNSLTAAAGSAAGSGGGAGAAGGYYGYGGPSAAAAAIGITSPTATASAGSAGAGAASPTASATNPPSLTYPLGMREPPAFLRSPDAALAMLESMKARNVHESPQIGSTTHGGGIVPGSTLQSLVMSATSYSSSAASAASSVPSYGFYDPVMTLLLYGGSLASIGIHTGGAGGAGAAGGMAGAMGLAMAGMGMGMGMGGMGMFGDEDYDDEMMYDAMYAAEAAAAGGAYGASAAAGRRGGAGGASSSTVPSDDGWSAARTTVARALATASREVRFGDIAVAMEQAVAELLGLLEGMPCPVTEEDLDRVGVPVPAGGVQALLQ